MEKIHLARLLIIESIKTSEKKHQQRTEESKNRPVEFGDMKKKINIQNEVVITCAQSPDAAVTADAADGSLK